ncbi:MAG: cytochrome c maturation protein CcmE [Rubricella sp.]
MATTLRKKRRMTLVAVGLVLIFAASGLFIVAIGEGGQFFRSPSQVFSNPPEEGEVFRLGGLVKEGTWERGQMHAFVVTDTAMDFPVVYEGIVPDLFREGQGTIVTGRIENGVFVASEVLARHDEDYMPAEVAEALQEQGLYRNDFN